MNLEQLIEAVSDRVSISDFRAASNTLKSMPDDQFVGDETWDVVFNSIASIWEDGDKPAPVRAQLTMVLYEALPTTLVAHCFDRNWEVLDEETQTGVFDWVLRVLAENPAIAGPLVEEIQSDWVDSRRTLRPDVDDAFDDYFGRPHPLKIAKDTPPSNYLYETDSP